MIWSRLTALARSIEPQMSRKTLARYCFRILPAVVAALLAGAANAQNETLPAALPEDLLPGLKALLEESVKQSPTLLARNIEVAQAEGQRIMDRANLFPTLSGYGSYSANESAVATTSSSKSKNDGFFYGVSFSQPVFGWGSFKAQADLGKLGRQVAEHYYAEAYRTLSLSIRSQYLGLVARKMTLRNLQSNLKFAENYLALQEARLRDGRISVGEITAPRLGVDESRIYVDRAQTDLDHSRRMLAALAGVQDIPEESIPSELPRPAYAAETLSAYFASWQNFAADDTPMADVYKDTIRQRELSYKIAKTRLLPKFYLNASYYQQNQTTVVTNRIEQTAITTTTYGITANWTLFDGLATRGAKLSALSARRLAERNLAIYQKSTTDYVRLLEKQIGFAGRLMDLTETRRDLALAAVKKVQDDVRSGVSSQSVLDNVTQLANKAELEALSARSEFLTRWSEYVSTLGVDPAMAAVSPRHLRNGK
jgi:outer membrane protein TolC